MELEEPGANAVHWTLGVHPNLLKSVAKPTSAHRAQAVSPGE